MVTLANSVFGVAQAPGGLLKTNRVQKPYHQWIYSQIYLAAYWYLNAALAACLTRVV